MQTSLVSPFIMGLAQGITTCYCLSDKALFTQPTRLGNASFIHSSKRLLKLVLCSRA